MKSRKSMLIGKIFLALSILCLFSTVVTAKPVENNDFGSVPIPVDRKLSDEEKAILARSQTEKFKKALEANDPNALADAITVYTRGLGVKKDVEQAKRYAQKGYNNKDPLCALYLVLCEIKDHDLHETNVKVAVHSLKILREAYDWSKNDSERMFLSYMIAALYYDYFQKGYGTGFYGIYAVPWAKKCLELREICGLKLPWFSSLDEEMEEIEKELEIYSSSETIHSVDALLEEYNNNIVRFKKRYETHFIAVTGLVGKVQQNPATNQYYVELRPLQKRTLLAEALLGTFIECSMKDVDALADLEMGQKVTLRGKYNSKEKFVIGTFHLAKCELYKDPPIAPPQAQEKQ